VAASAGAGSEGPAGLAYRVGVDSAVDRLLLAGGDPTGVIGLAPRRLPLSGSAIIARGVAPGPQVARMLQEVERRWIAAGFPPSADAIADDVVAQALRSTSSA
jgi:poly(A) polymerase